MNWNIKNYCFNYFKDMVEENISQGLRFKNIDKTRNYFFDEVKQ